MNVSPTVPRRRPRGPRGKVRVYLLGEMRLVMPGGVNVLPGKRKTRAVLAYLCLARGERVARTRLMRLLWDQRGDSEARLSLRQAVAELVRVLEGEGPNPIETDRDTVRLDLRNLWIDALTSIDGGNRLLEDLEGVTPQLDEWIHAERKRVLTALRDAMDRELAQLVAEGAPPRICAEAAAKLVDVDPAHEPAVQILMRSLLEIGDRSRAIFEFRRCEEALRAIGLVPSRDTTAFYEAIMKPQAPPPPPTASGVGEASGPSIAGAQPFNKRPLVVVLPFLDLPSEGQDRSLGLGLAEELIQALGRVPDLGVASRLASLALRGTERMPREIALAAEAQYVLSGSARASATRLRLTIELTDARTGLPVWSSGRDDPLDDPLDAQRQAAEAIVGELALHIRRAELNRARLKGPDERDAYDLFLRARQSMHDFSRRSFDGAEELFDEVFERQPCYPEALAARAYWHMLRVGQGWSPDPGEDVARADDFVRRAIECAVPTASAFAVQGHVAAYLHKDFRAAFEAFDLALDIDPNAATAWMWRAAAHAYVGRGQRAVEAIERALALSPYDPMIYAFTSIASLSCLAQGQTERAVGFARRSVAENRTYTTAYKLLVMSLGLAGRTADAISAAEQLLTLEPDFSVALFRERSPTTASDLSVAYCKALASAGIPHS